MSTYGLSIHQDIALAFCIEKVGTCPYGCVKDGASNCDAHVRNIGLAEGAQCEPGRLTAAAAAEAERAEERAKKEEAMKMDKRQALKQFKTGDKAWAYFRNGKDNADGIFYAFEQDDGIVKERVIEALKSEGKITSVTVFFEDKETEELIDVRYYCVLASADVPSQEVRRS